MTKARDFRRTQILKDLLGHAKVKRDLFPKRWKTTGRFYTGK